MTDILNKRKWPNPVFVNPYTGQVDAFGRIKVASPESLSDSKQLHDKLPLFWDEKITNGSGNATSTHSQVDASVLMHVEAGDTIIRQQKTHNNYQPYKAQEGAFTGVLDFLGGTGQGVTAEIGLFTASDGVFFRAKDGQLFAVIRKEGVDNAIPQSDWNIDRMDGTGVSGITLNPEKAQILYIDYEWLGVGDVRFAIFAYGTWHCCHWQHHFNQLTKPYMSTPNLPARYSISTTNEPARLRHVCSSIVSNGGKQDSGQIYRITNTPTGITATTADAIYAALAIRLKTTHLDATVKPLGSSFLLESADTIEWFWVLNPTVAGTFTYSDVANTSIQLAVGQGGGGGNNNLVTNNSWSLQIDGDYVISSGSGGKAAGAGGGAVQSVVALGSTIDGVRDTMVLCVRGLSAGAIVQVSAQIKELV